MPEIRQLKCPNCGASLSAPVDATRVTCEFCGAKLAVEPNSGEAYLLAGRQIVGAISEQGQNTVSELQRMQLQQQRASLTEQYNTLTVHRDNLQNQLYTVQRGPKDRLAVQQANELWTRITSLDSELAAMKGQITDIDAVLYPSVRPMHVPVATPGATLPAGTIQFAPQSVQTAQTPIGCGNILYFLFMGWWAALYWVILGLMMLFTVVGFHLALAFWQTAGTIAMLRSREESVGQTFKRQWAAGRAWYGSIPVISNILPYPLALVIALAILFAIGGASPRTPAPPKNLSGKGVTIGRKEDKLEV